MENKNYLNDVETLTYSKESEIVLIRGNLALDYEDYIDGGITLHQYQAKKAMAETKLEKLSIP